MRRVRKTIQKAKNAKETRLSFEPVLTTEDTKAGEAVVLRDGWALVKNSEGVEVSWDVAKQADALHKANGQAKSYRESFVALAKSSGYSSAIEGPGDVPALIVSLETVGPDREELTTLRRLKDAGDLDDSADDKISAAAKKLYGDDYTKVEAKAKKAEAEKARSDAQASRDRSALHTSKTEDAFADFYDRCMADKTGKLPVLREGGRAMFIRAGMAPDGKGRRWQWTGESNGAGIATIRQRDAADENTRMGPDGIDPLSLRRWVETDLRESDQLLFKSPNGTDPLNPGQPGKKGWDQQPMADIEAQVDGTA